MSSDINTLWSSWIDFVESKGFSARASFEPAASDADILTLERATGLQLPEPMKQLYHIANGQKPRSSPALFNNYYEFLSTWRAADGWRLWKSVQEDLGPDEMADIARVTVKVSQPDLVKKEYWIEGWLPFATDGGGNSLALDFMPESQGTSGQIIVIGSDEDHRRVLASGIAELLQRMIDAAQSGKIEIQEERYVIPWLRWHYLG